MNTPPASPLIGSSSPPSNVPTNSTLGGSGTTNRLLAGRDVTQVPSSSPRPGSSSAQSANSDPGVPLASRHISEAPRQQSALLPSRQAASPLSGSKGVAGGSGAGSTETNLPPLDPNYKYTDQDGRDVMKKREGFIFQSRSEQKKDQQAAIDNTPPGRSPLLGH